MQTPTWCIKESRKSEINSLMLNCAKISGYNVPTSEILTFAPGVTCAIDFTSLSFFMYYMYYKFKWKETSKDRKRVILMLVIFVLCCIDMIVSIIMDWSPFVTNFTRPIVILIFMHSSRAHLWSVFKLMKRSLVILLSIFIYVAFTSFIGFFLFKNTMEGYTYFKTPGTALY